MAAIRMTHAEHGYHIASDGAEVDRLEKAGWKKISDAEFKAVLAAKMKAGVVEEVTEVVEAPKKRGPKPKA